MRSIAAASGTVEKTLFNIFGSKDCLLAMAAFERSASVFELASARAQEPGWYELTELCNAIAEVTLEAPEMARALAVPLLEHFELVGLDKLYNEHVGDALEVMVKDGQLDPAARKELLAHVVQLGVVASVIFWAKNELADGELAPFLHLRISETLLPHATSDFVPTIKQVIDASLSNLAEQRSTKLGT